MASSIASEILTNLRRAYDTGRTKRKVWRTHQLKQLGQMLERETDRIVSAIASDLGRAKFEAWASEIGPVLAETRTALDELSDWMKPRKATVPLIFQPAKASVHPEPKGVVLILGPWNYPIQLILAPLVGAIAAGNCVVLKPSELAPHSSRLMAELLPRYLDQEAVQVVEGGVDVAQDLLAQPFNHIFFTGGTAVGRLVMRAAAEHLTPVTLELGGKSPVLVDETIDLKLAARRIAWGKALNAGQTCLAPDYVLVHQGRSSELAEAIAESFQEFYGDNSRASKDYGRIVNTSHFDRLMTLLEGAQIHFGGDSHRPELYIEPTIVWDPQEDHPLMQEEIFGPILPIVPYNSLQQALEVVQRRPDPLAFYLFSSDKRVHERVRSATRSGAFVINDTIVHVMSPDLPFGGIGPSGMGTYHGRAGFETFSHPRGVYRASARLDPPLRYPPYNESLTRWLKRVF